MGQVLPPNTISTTVNYYLTPDKGGHSVFYPGKASNLFRNKDPQHVHIRDIREASESFSLDKQGFDLVSYPAFDCDMTDENAIKAEVYPDVVRLLKTVTGATHVHPFSHLVRSMSDAKAQELAKGLPAEQQTSFKSTAAFVHVDQSDVGAYEQLQTHLPAEDAARLSKTRWAMINVWRPIGQVVRREPLAMCDARSVSESDYRATEAVLPPKGSGTFEGVSELSTLKLLELVVNPQHRWYYASELAPDEALVLKIFDSKRDGRARRSAHTAFTSDRDSGPPRHSIEVRSLVFWEDQSVE